MDDIWLCVYLELPIEDAYRLSMVNKNCYNVFISKHLWIKYDICKFDDVYDNNYNKVCKMTNNIFGFFLYPMRYRPSFRYNILLIQ